MDQKGLRKKHSLALGMRALASIQHHWAKYIKEGCRSQLDYVSTRNSCLPRNENKPTPYSTQIATFEVEERMRATRTLVPALLMAASFCYQALSTPMKFTETPKLGLTSARQEYGEWADCSFSRGVCMNTNFYRCTNGVLLAGQCPGGTNILCCTAPGGIKYGQCGAARNGLCKRTEDCLTSTVRGLCPGPSSVKCCVWSAVSPAIPWLLFVPVAQ